LAAWHAGFATDYSAAVMGQMPPLAFHPTATDSPALRAEAHSFVSLNKKRAVVDIGALLPECAAFGPMPPRLTKKSRFAMGEDKHGFSHEGTHVSRYDARAAQAILDMYDANTPAEDRRYDAWMSETSLRQCRYIVEAAREQELDWGVTEPTGVYFAVESYRRYWSRRGAPIANMIPYDSDTPFCGRMKRELRAALLHKFYYDVDMKNAHPSVLLSVVGRVEMPMLADYVAHRTRYLDLTMAVHPSISKAQAKDLFRAAPLRRSPQNMYANWYGQLHLPDPKAKARSFRRQNAAAGGQCDTLRILRQEYEDGLPQRERRERNGPRLDEEIDKTCPS
jgi:hypothetical protein